MRRFCLVAMLAAPPRPEAQTQPGQAQVSPSQPLPIKYVPQAQYCANGSNVLCSVLAAYIGPDPLLKIDDGYNGLYGAPPRSASEDVQTPFDNMAWQMFVALNWTANAVNQPAADRADETGAAGLAELSQGQRAVRQFAGPCGLHPGAGLAGVLYRLRRQG